MLVFFKKPHLMLMLSCKKLGMRQIYDIWLRLKVLSIFGRTVVWSLGR
jgi:hypothetical protein